MNIIHAGLMVNGRDEGLSKELRKVSDQYHECGVNRDMVNHIKGAGFKPDILFMQIHNNVIDGVDTCHLLLPIVNELKYQGCRVINWNGDIRKFYPSWMNQLGASVNAFSNMRDVKQASNGKFLQIGIDPVTFKKWDVTPTNDIVFMGNNYGNMFPLSSFRNEAARLVRRKFNGKLYGNYEGSVKNLNADPNKPFPNQSEESKVYSGCAIAISISHFNVERYTSDRLLRCMGSGAFTLAHHYEGIETDFDIGVHLDTFKTVAEMEDKIRYYIENEERRNEIAKSGYEHIHEKFTYKSMAENILKL